MTAPALRVAEPPAQFLAPRPLVVDGSVISGALFAEHWQAEAEQHLAGRELHAPSLIQAEIANVAVKKIRQGFAESSSEGLKKLQQLTIHLHRIDEVAVVELAQRYQLSAYDAAYLWVAADLRCPLATFDIKLAQAAQAHLSGLA